MNPASCMHNSHDSWAREGKNMFVMTLFLHTIPRFPFPHAPGFVNWRDYALNTGSYPGWSFRKCIELSGRQVPQGFFLSFNVYLSNLLNFKWIFTCLCRQNHHGWFSRCWRSAYAKGGIQLASLHRGSSYCYRISAVSWALKTPSSGY